MVFHLGWISNPPIGEVIQSNNQGLLSKEFALLACMPLFCPWCVRVCSRDNFGTGGGEGGFRLLRHSIPSQLDYYASAFVCARSIDGRRKKRWTVVHSFEIRKSSACDCTRIPGLRRRAHSRGTPSGWGGIVIEMESYNKVLFCNNNLNPPSPRRHLDKKGTVFRSATCII